MGFRGSLLTHFWREKKFWIGKNYCIVLKFYMGVSYPKYKLLVK